jgi:hypothetical protein
VPPGPVQRGEVVTQSCTFHARRTELRAVDAQPVITTVVWHLRLVQTPTIGTYGLTFRRHANRRPPIRPISRRPNLPRLSFPRIPDIMATCIKLRSKQSGARVHGLASLRSARPALGREVLGCSPFPLGGLKVHRLLTEVVHMKSALAPSLRIPIRPIALLAPRRDDFSLPGSWQPFPPYPLPNLGMAMRISQ